MRRPALILLTLAVLGAPLLGGSATARPGAPGDLRGCTLEGRTLVQGTDGRDALESTDAAEVLDGGAGNDRIQGDEGDCVLGGPGDDRIELYAGDAAHGGPGDDRVFAQTTPATITGGAGDDRLELFDVETLRAGRVDAGPGADVVKADDDTTGVVRCGRGRDLAEVDAGDRPSSCERLTDRFRRGPLLLSPARAARSATIRVAGRIRAFDRTEPYFVSVEEGPRGCTSERELRVRPAGRDFVAFVRPSDVLPRRRRTWCRGTYRLELIGWPPGSEAGLPRYLLAGTLVVR